MKNLFNSIGDKARTWLMKFIEAAKRMPVTFKKIKPYATQLIYDVVILMIYVEETDHELFESDPGEYICD